MDDKRITALEKDVEDIKAQLNRYKGFIGGIVFITSCIVTAVTLAVHWFKS